MEEKLAENVSLIPQGRITSIQFSLASSEEIVTASNPHPIQQSSQLSGPLLGLPTESNKCSSCGSYKLDECEGHFGHIRLPAAVYHPSHIQEVARILGKICLNCFKLKKKKIMKSVKEILQKNKTTDRKLDLEGMKTKNSTKYKTNGIRNAESTIVSDTSSNSEEDPLLRSLIPSRTHVLHNPSKIKKSHRHISKNFKFIKETSKAGMQQTKQNAATERRKVTSNAPNIKYGKDDTKCKYCEVIECAEKQSANSYPAIKVKTVPADNGKIRVIQMSSCKELPSKFWEFVDRYSGCCSENKSSRTLLPFEALNILKQIPEMTSKRFGVIPEGLIWECLPVPPNCTRISGAAFRTMRVGTDEATRMLKRIVNTVGKIGESRGSKPTFDTIKHESKLLQSLCTEYLQAQGGSKVPRDKESEEFYSRSIGKTNSSENKWGQRIETFLKKTSGFSARGIITGDALRQIDQIGIPLEVANSITVEERITSYNKENMQNIVSRGLYTLLVDRGGNRRSREYLQPEKVVEIGEIVHRQLADGDIVIVNRPPSTHKHSFLALQACIQPSYSFNISPLICAPLDADFDGDCLHVFVPQNLQSRAELSQILTLDHQLIDSQNGEILLMLTQDTLLAASLILSMPFTNQTTLHQLSMWASSAVPWPAIISSPHGGPYWTGLQIFQMLLPPEVYCVGNGLHIDKSELLFIQDGAKLSHNSVELIIHSLILQKGPKEALKFLNSAQHCLTEWLSQQGISVGLDDVHPFQGLLQKKDLSETIKKCFADATPLLKQKTLPPVDDTIVPYLEDRVSEAYNKVLKYFSKSNTLFAISGAGSGRSMTKVAQQTEFLGLQVFKGKELIPEEWSNRFLLSLNLNMPSSYDVNVCEARGLILSSFANGLNPHEAFINAVSSRETLFCKALEVKEPGILFKKLNAFLRDIIICYDGTVRTTQGKHLIQFGYECDVRPKESAIRTKNTKLKLELQPGEPVGVLAATALANPSYKILLDAVQRNISSWYLLKETLFHGLGSRLKVSDQTVILRLQNRICSGTYSSEKFALQIQRHLGKVPLKYFSVSIKVGYSNTDTTEDFAKTFVSARSPFVGHVQLDKGLLQQENLSVEALLLNVKKSIRCQRNSLSNLSHRLILWISDACSAEENSKEPDFQMPCLHFSIEASNSSDTDEDIVDIMVNVICPELLETTVKGDDRIQSAKVSWSPVDSESWVPFNSHQPVEGEIIIEVIVEKSEVKQCGDAWKIIQDACMPLMNSVNSARCIPYSINEIYKYFGITAAYYLLLQRLLHAINSIGSHVYREHLILISNYMCSSGTITGFTAGGYRRFLHSMEMSTPFAEAGMRTPLKCFERAAERGQEDDLSSTLAACCWGKCPSLGTGGEFQVLWSSREADSECKHEDVYDFLENMGIIPYEKEESSLEFRLYENLYDGIDDTSEFGTSNAIFEDSTQETGVANFNDKDLVNSWEASTLSNSKTNGWGSSPNQTDAREKIGNSSGWQATTMSDTQTDGWVCSSDMEASKHQTLSWDKHVSDCLDALRIKTSALSNEEISDKIISSQLKVVNGWDTQTSLVNDLNNAKVNGTQTESRWSPDAHISGQTDSKVGWPEHTITDVQGQNLKPDTTGEINSTSGWENLEVSSALHPKKKSTWESSLQGPKIEVTEDRFQNKKKERGSNWPEDEVTKASSWNSCIDGWTNNDSHNKSQDNSRKGHYQRSAWGVDSQGCNVTDSSDWNTNMESISKNTSTDGGTESKNSNWSVWESSKDDSIKKRCTGRHNPSSERHKVDKHDNKKNLSKISRFQKSVALQWKVNNVKKYVEGQDSIHHSYREREISLNETKDPDFPPGFPIVEKNYTGEIISSQQIDDTSLPSTSDISKSCKWGDHTNEQGENELSFSGNIKTNNRIKFKRTGPKGKPFEVDSVMLNPLGKRTSSGFQKEERNKTTSQEIDQDEREFKAAQVTGRNMDLHPEVKKASCTTTQTSIGRAGEVNSSQKNLSERDQVDDGNTRIMNVDHLGSPKFDRLSQGEQDDSKPSSSCKSHKCKQTGANIVPLGTRSQRGAQSKALIKEGQTEECRTNCPVEEDSERAWTSRESSRKGKHSESGAQEVFLSCRNLNDSGNSHTPTISGHTDGWNTAAHTMTEQYFSGWSPTPDTMTEQDFSGWNPRPETLTEQDLCGWNPRPEIVTEQDSNGWNTRQQTVTEQDSNRWNQIPDPIIVSSSMEGLESENVDCSSGMPIIRGCELPSQSAERPTVKLYTLKSMDDVEPSSDNCDISSKRYIKRDGVHLDLKNSSARKYATPRNYECLRERAIDRPPKLQEILHEINPLMNSMRKILHLSSYNSGDRLRPEDERQILEKVLLYHPEAEAKMGCGIDYILIDNHADFPSTRCFYIVRKDGTKTDFSYLKCLKGLVAKKFPDSAEAFIEKYFTQKR